MDSKGRVEVNDRFQTNVPRYFFLPSLCLCMYVCVYVRMFELVIVYILQCDYPVVNACKHIGLNVWIRCHSLALARP